MSNFAQTLLAWYKEHQRQLPWRKTSDPYLIWVSEIILQQTRIAQGYDYYERFVSRFPTIQSLAQASEDEVLKVWQGLGYYSRARNIQFAAQQIMSNYGGQFPDTFENIRTLKGVGDYTAAAISSFAFKLPYAVVDGNVYRVLSRHFGVNFPIDNAQGKKYFAQLAQELLPTHHSADYNQAIMDFGALQCTPTSPQCPVCPLVNSCLAWEEKRVEMYPVKTHRTKVQECHFTYLFICTPSGMWLHRREGKDIWQGLYEPFLVESEHTLTLHKLRARLSDLPLPVDGVWKELKRGVKHILSHRLIKANFFQFTSPIEIPPMKGFKLVPYTDLTDYAMPQLIVKQIELIR